MKRILIILISALLFVGCGGNVYDKTIALYEDAMEHVQQAGSKEEMRQAERELRTEYSRLLREHASEISQLEQKAAAGDRKVLKQQEKVKKTQRAYIDVKNAKRKQLCHK
jgi:uncharacterized protein YxeA